jgi:hypothetical protein
MAINGVALTVLGAGAVLLWSAVSNQHVTTTIQDIIKGQTPPAGPMEQGSPSSASTTAGGGGGGGSSAPAAPANVSGNVAIGKMLAAARGWTGGQWDALYALWQRESGWDNLARNASSGAYGIAQALGHGPTNQYPAGPANPPTSSATAQIEWGLGYIASTYGTPEAAWAHEESAGWY